MSMTSNNRASVESQSPRSFRGWLVGQFGRPTGAWGHVVGWMMAHRTSNRRRNRWTVDLLDLRPGERVLEIGFGPGLALEQAARRVGEGGLVVGIDRSAVMLAQAGRRNAGAVARGRMNLQQADVDALPHFGIPFDAILTVNSVGFWMDPVTRLRELRERLRPGGRIAITVQPRSRGATAATSMRVQGQIDTHLREAGFATVTTHVLEDLDPPAVCLVGTGGSLVPS